jgi:hypothetical protein
MHVFADRLTFFFFNYIDFQDINDYNRVQIKYDYMSDCYGIGLNYNTI